MRVTLTAADQFGPDGPQAGDKFDVFSFTMDENDDLWFQGFWLGHEASSYFILHPQMVRTDYHE
jgi:hypothetical protein